MQVEDCLLKSSSITTAEAIAKFIEDRKFRERRPGTVANYEQFLKRSFDGLAYVPTDPAIIRGILSNFHADTKLTYWLYFSAFYRFCELEYPGLPNPMVRVPRPSKGKTLPDHLNPQQKQQLQEANLNHRDRAIIKLFVETAARPGEVGGNDGHPLRFCDIYEAHIEVSGKTGERGIPLTAELRDMLLSLRAGRPNDAPVFTSSNNGAALSRWGLGKVVRRAFAIAGIRGVKACPYTLRHSFAADYLDRDGDMATLQRILGHKNIATTMTYTHIADKAVIDAYRRHGPRANNNK